MPTRQRFLSSLLASAVIALPSALLAIDTDQDGLDDSVETHTGTYVSPANTGTNPNNPDSDGDGAGDWYEVTATFTNPNLATSKPNVRYPLPAPDASAGATDKPVKVFILSGQSNMEGQGNISPLGTAGTLETLTRNEFKFPNLLNGAAWSVRNDVRYRGVVAAIKNELLTAGEGTNSTTIGPELGFGHVMGYFLGEPVLVLKASEGGKSLGGDFLPPGTRQYNYSTKTYAGSGQSPASWDTGTTPVADPAFYGGIQFDKCFRAKADWYSAGAALPAVTNVTTVLDNFATEYPQWAAQGFEIAGFAWFHGWNDGLSSSGQYSSRYEQNMARFIRQIRTYYEGRYPGKIKSKAPFVIASAAFEGLNEAYYNQYPTRRAVLDAQLAVGNPALYPDFANNVKSFDARAYWRDKAISPISSGNQGYHYNRNAETFMLVGDALGRAMIDLLSTDYDTWSAQWLVANLKDPAADLDGDGLTNNQERAWGLDPTSGASANPVSVPFNASTGTLTYTRRNPALNTALSYRYEWSGTLAPGDWDPFTPANELANGASPVESVIITLPAELLTGTKIFVRVVAE
jgi:alpha-galactosidase